MHNVHHSSPAAPYCPKDNCGIGYACADCHNDNVDSGPFGFHCTKCHVHGGDDSWLKNEPGIVNGDHYYTGRHTF